MNFNKTSKNFILGTAQLYDDYGITNNTTNSKKHSFEILKIASENNLKLLDTAQNYSNSEKLIAEFSDIYGVKFNILNKLSINRRTKYNESDIKKKIEKSLILNKKNSFESFLIHDYNYFINNQDDILKILTSYVKTRDIKSIGISLYHTDEFDFCYNFKELKVLQVPLSIINLKWSQYLNSLKQKKNKIILARSVFHQGLLLNTGILWPTKFEKYKNKINSNLRIILKKFEVKNMYELLISYVLSHKLIDNFILGISDVKDITYAINNLSNLISFKKNDFETIHSLIPQTSDNFLYPYKW